MLDLLAVVIVVAFFAGCAALVRGSTRIVREDEAGKPRASASYAAASDGLPAVGAAVVTATVSGSGSPEDDEGVSRERQGG